jgi:hypothetical protein
MPMNQHELYILNNFDFIARSFARMHSLGQSVDLDAVTGNMDEAQREWFYIRYEFYCQQAMRVRSPEVEH